MLKGRIRTLAVAGGTIVAAALVALSATSASAATTAASTPAHVTAPTVAAASGCVTETFSIADQGTFERCVRDEQVLLNNIWSKNVVPGLQQLMVDGLYGSHTRDDVKAFQSDLLLTVDGETGPQTWWWVCRINSNGGDRGVYWHDAGCNTEPANPPA
jgi:peptidoglycan hydrolase-like protein with peptidoglycan-binding domain